jgi:hypothetical protein
MLLVYVSHGAVHSPIPLLTMLFIAVAIVVYWTLTRTTCSSGRGSTYCAYSGSQSARAALIAGHRRGSLVIYEAMLLTLLLDPHSFFPPGFWQIAAILLVTVAVIIWLVVDLVRRLWRSENQLARLGGRLVVLVLVIAIMYFWIGPMQLRL